MLICILDRTNTLMCYTVFPYLLTSHSVAGVPAESLLEWNRVHFFFCSPLPHSLHHHLTSDPLLSRIIRNGVSNESHRSTSLPPSTFPFSSSSLPPPVLPPYHSTSSWWCGHLSIKRGWVSHLPFGPLIVWHTVAQHGCHRLHRAWIRWPDYLSVGFHFPHTHVLHWKQITHNRDETSQMTNQSTACNFDDVSVKCIGQTVFTQRSGH